MERARDAGSALTISISHGCRPADNPQHAGGDFLTFSRRHNGTVSFVIGDVSAKGARAAEQAFHLCRAAKLAAMLTSQPREILTHVNGVFERQFARRRTEGFACVAAGTLDPRTALLHYVAAGTEAALLIRNRSAHDHLPSTGPAIGICDEGTWTELAVPFEPGDALILFYRRHNGIAG